MLLIAVTDEGRPHTLHHASTKNGFDEPRHSCDPGLPPCDCSAVAFCFANRQGYDWCAAKLHQIAPRIIVASGMRSDLCAITSKRFRNAAKELSPVAIDNVD